MATPEVEATEIARQKTLNELMEILVVTFGRDEIRTALEEAIGVENLNEVTND